MGVAEGDVEQFSAWSRDISHIVNPLASPDERAREGIARNALDAFFLSGTRARREAPRDDLLSALVAVEQAGKRLTEDELVDMCRLFLVAGNVTTADLIANGTLSLLEHPEALRALREGTVSCASAVEEMLRFTPPVTMTTRIVDDDLEIGGCPIHRLSNVTALLAAANRDPRVFDHPERFDPSRSPNPHLSFGGGTRICLGAPLARVGATIAFEVLLERFQTLELAVPRSELSWRRAPFFRGLEHLPIRATLA
jgi:cytochrome P450